MFRLYCSRIQRLCNYKLKVVHGGLCKTRPSLNYAKYSIVGSDTLCRERKEMPRVLSNKTYSGSHSIQLVQRNYLFQKASKNDIDMHHPEKGQLIYVGALSSYVKGVKVFSLTTSIMFISIQPWLISTASKVQTSLLLKLLAGGFLNFFAFLTPVALHIISKRYATHIYYNSTTETFSANTYTFFLQKKEHKFKAEDVVIPEVTGIFSTIIVKGKPLFFDPDLFTNTKAYMKMMSYDKPIDWDSLIKEDVEERDDTKSDNIQAAERAKK